MLLYVQQELLLLSSRQSGATTALLLGKRLLLQMFILPCAYVLCLLLVLQDELALPMKKLPRGGRALGVQLK